MLALDPDSQDELDEIGDDALRVAVDRVRSDPSGRRQPCHNYTRRFRNPRRYVNVRKDEKVWEFCTNHWRALFVTVQGPSGGKGIYFVPVKGRRFWTMNECPWH